MDSTNRIDASAVRTGEDAGNGEGLRALALLVGAKLWLSGALLVAGFVFFSGDEWVRLRDAWFWARSPVFVDRAMLESALTPGLVPVWGIIVGLTGDPIWVPRLVSSVASALGALLVGLATRELVARDSSATVRAVAPAIAAASVAFGEVGIIVAGTANTEPFVWLSSAAMLWAVARGREIGDRALLACAFLAGFSTSLRYELWPVVALWAPALAWRRLRTDPDGRPRNLAVAVAVLALAAIFPLFWIGASSVVMGEPFGFLGHTSDALGARFGPTSATERLRIYPEEFLRVAWFWLAAAMFGAWASRRDAAVRWAGLAPLAVALGFVAMMSVAATRSALPTWYSVRILLPALVALAPSAGIGAARLWCAGSERGIAALIARAAAAVIAGAMIVQIIRVPVRPRPNDVIEAAGELRGFLDENPGATVLVDASDWSWVALQVACRHPDRVLPDRSQPRDATAIPERLDANPAWLDTARVAMVLVRSPEVAEALGQRGVAADTGRRAGPWRVWLPAPPASAPGHGLPNGVSP